MIIQIGQSCLLLNGMSFYIYVYQDAYIYIHIHFILFRFSPSLFTLSEFKLSVTGSIYKKCRSAVVP